MRKLLFLYLLSKNVFMSEKFTRQWRFYIDDMIGFVESTSIK